MFAGPTTVVTTTDSQRITGVVEMSMGSTVATGSTFQYSLCRQPGAGGTITPIGGGISFHVGQITAQRVGWTASASGIPGSGTWLVGGCVNSSININSTDFATGWAMVTN